MILTRYTLLKLLKNKWNQSITKNLQLILRKLLLTVAWAGRIPCYSLLKKKPPICVGLQG